MASTAEVDLGEGNFTGLATNQELTPERNFEIAERAIEEHWWEESARIKLHVEASVRESEAVFCLGASRRHYWFAIHSKGGYSTPPKTFWPITPAR
jgi:hypothetical protein